MAETSSFVASVFCYDQAIKHDIREKYPEENSFDVYCSKHGGYTDASTDYESVSYHQIDSS